MTTLDGALKSFTFPITGIDEKGRQLIVRLDERDRKNLIEHLRVQGFEIVTRERAEALLHGDGFL